MLFPTHLAVAGGTVAVLKYFGISDPWLTAGILTVSVLPDLDVIWSRGIEHHHETAFHTPLFWILVSTIVWPFYGMAALGILIGSMEHMLLDTFGYSSAVHWLAPFSKRSWSFTALAPYGSFSHWMRGYVKSRIFTFEIVIIGAMIGIIAGLQ